MSFWEIIWFIIVSFVFIAYLMMLFHFAADLFRDRNLSGGIKAVWLVCLVFFPLVTAVVYLIVRGQGMADRQAKAAYEAAAAQEAYIRSVASSGSGAATEISQAKALLDSGAITQDEFQALKLKALG